MLRFLLPLALLPLVACSPAEQCRMSATRDLRVLDRQIADSEQAVRTGYRTVTVDNPFRVGLTLCVDPSPRSRLCADDDYPRTYRERVNVEAERAKLESLRAQRARLEPSVRQRLAACPAA